MKIELNISFKLKILVCSLSMTILACDNGVQTNNKKTEGSDIQNSKNSLLDTPQLAGDSLNIDFILARGYDFYQKHDLENAMKEFVKVYQIDNQNIAALITIGNIYYDAGQDKNAIEYYQKVLAIEPNRLDVRCDMATSYSKLGNFDEAIKINKKTIEMDFNHAQSHHNLAVFYDELGKKKQADEERKLYHHIISGHQ